MIAKLKKWIIFNKKKKIVVDTGLNEDILERIRKLITVSDILSKVYTPHGKLYLLNVYYLSFNHLTQNLINDKVTARNISAINIYSYFKDCDDINNYLEKILPLVTRAHLTGKVKHDLLEVLEAIEYLIKTDKGA